LCPPIQRQITSAGCTLPHLLYVGEPQTRLEGAGRGLSVFETFDT
jgi:hypothetical protein